MTNNMYNSLLDKIDRKKAKIGLIGIGYVGRAIGEGAARAGYTVIGFGRRNEPVEHINSKHIKEFTATTHFEDLSSCDIICSCVPTPVNEDKTPDLEPLISSTKRLANILKKGQLIVIESSIAPGMTRSVVLPILNESGLVPEEDYFLAYSPERIDPGNPQFSFSDIPKVVSGYGEQSCQLAYEWYSRIVVSAHKVSSMEAAEFSKILENTFRLINISLVNELQIYAEAIGVNMWEVVQAASTKPFAFMPHYPGPGIGGHCIPVDPHYLRQDAEQRGIKLSMIEAASNVNDNQPKTVAKKSLSIVNSKKHNGTQPRILLIGITYKPDVDDLRESPALRIWNYLTKQNAIVDYHDSHISEYNGKKSIPLSHEVIKSYDLAVIVSNHSNIDYSLLHEAGIPILDTRNVYNGSGGSHVYHL